MQDESILKGDKVILSPDKGKVVGGEIQAKHLVSANTFGNSMEKATKIQVKGFDRNKVKALDLRSQSFSFFYML